LKKCNYCDFYSVPYKEDMADAYLNALLEEISDAPYTPPVDTVYIGGGTPSLYSPEAIERLIDRITVRFSISERPEITMEINPGTTDTDKLIGYRTAGINRLSIGVQSLDEYFLRFLGRIHSPDDARECLKQASRIFENFSADIIYAIPGQTERVLKGTLSEILSYSPRHISAYELTPEEETPLYRLLMEGRTVLPMEEEVGKQYFTVSSILHSEGFIHYEISNHALPGYECKHNLKYWRREEYLGFGASAHSFFRNRRYETFRDIPLYVERISSGERVYNSVISLTREDILKERVFLGLRMKEGVEMEGLPFSVKDLEELIMGDFVTIQENRASLTERGMLLSNSILSRLFAIIENRAGGQLDEHI